MVMPNNAAARSAVARDGLDLPVSIFESEMRVMPISAASVSCETRCIPASRRRFSAILSGIWRSVSPKSLVLYGYRDDGARRASSSSYRSKIALRLSPSLILV